MPEYTKFMKELVTKKRTLECKTIEVSHKCSAILTNNLVVKKDGQGAPTNPFTIGACNFAKACVTSMLA